MTWKDGVAKQNNKETYLKWKYKELIILIEIIKSPEPDGCSVKCPNGSVKLLYLLTAFSYLKSGGFNEEWWGTHMVIIFQ